MIGELFFALVRIAIYFFVFYFIYRLLGNLFRGLRGDHRNSRAGPQQSSPPKKNVETYTDVEDAKFKDIPPETDK